MVVASGDKPLLMIIRLWLEYTFDEPSFIRSIIDIIQYKYNLIQLMNIIRF